jgi:hypothetical protein
MHRLVEAVARLGEAVTVTPTLSSRAQPWRRVVRDRLTDVSSELSAESAVAADTWLDARAGHLHRERNRLLAKVAVLLPMVDHADVDAVRAAVARLAQDLEHHHQRVSDLAYDGVAMEVGGSE